LSHPTRHGGPIASAELYDPLTGTFQPTYPLSQPRSGLTLSYLTTGPHAGAVLVLGNGYIKSRVADGRVLVLGVIRRAGTSGYAVYLYDPVADAWIERPAADGAVRPRGGPSGGWTRAGRGWLRHRPQRAVVPGHDPPRRPLRGSRRRRR